MQLFYTDANSSSQTKKQHIKAGKQTDRQTGRQTDKQNEGIIVLGTPVSNSSFTSKVCTDFAQSGSLLCEELLQLGDTQSAMLLLRYCHAHCLCHLLRNIPPDELRPATIIHDTQTQTTFTKLLNVNDMTAEAW